MKNAVNHPEHYQGKHECIDIMRILFGDKAVKGFCKCNSFKYRFRAGRKAGEEAEKDLAKAEWYEDYLFQMKAEKKKKKAKKAKKKGASHVNKESFKEYRKR